MKNLREMAGKIIRDIQKPLSPVEIWEIAQPLGYKEKLNLNGSTIPATIGAILHTDIKNNPNSLFIKIKTKPMRYYLKDLPQNFDINLLDNQPTKNSPQNTKSYTERDLHPLLSYYVYTYKSIYTKTIYHEISTKKQFSQWQHPDIVGVFYPMEEWENDIFDIVNFTGNQSVKLFSYELKKTLDFSNLRESFFQAVSNSSWANEGYLVVSEIDQDDDFMTEIRRLSNSFGIGLILLDINNPDDSKILLEARQKDILDIEMMNKISQINPNFKEFLVRIKTDLNSKEIRKEKFDKVLESEEIIKIFKK